VLSIAAISELAISEEGEEELVAAVEPEIDLDRRPVLIEGGFLHRVDRGYLFGDTNSSVLLERVGLTLEGMGRDGTLRSNPNSVKLFRELWPLFRGEIGTEIFISVGAQLRTAEDPILWQGPFSFIIGQDVSIQPLLEGCFLAWRFTSTNQPPWSLLAIDADIEPTGEVYAQ